MTLEACSPPLDLLAILTAVAFITSGTAIGRSEWLNAKVAAAAGHREPHLPDRGGGAVLLTGLACIRSGIKGDAW